MTEENENKEEPEEVEELDKSEEDNGNDDKEELMRKRVTTVLSTIGGLLSGYITISVLSFEVYTSVLVPMSFGLLISLFSYIYFNNFTKKTAPYIILINILVWFISGTIIIQ